mgnify:CR=1 FL=1
MVAMIDSFLKTTPVRLEDAREGLLASDADRVRRALHTLGSSAGQLGAGDLAELCRDGESRAREADLTAIGPLLLRLAEELQLVTSRLSETKKGSTRG